MSCSKSLFDKIRLRVGSTPEIRLKHQQERMEALNKRLQSNLDSMKLSDEILNKRCTL